MVHSENFIKELENMEKNQMKNSVVEIKNILEEMIISKGHRTHKYPGRQIIESSQSE